MSGISFFTPVRYGSVHTSCGQKLLEGVDSYFHIKGPIAKIVARAPDVRDSREVELKKVRLSCILTAFKVVSYFTLIIPMIMLVAKALLRSNYLFHTCSAVRPIVDPRPPIIDGFPGPAPVPRDWDDDRYQVRPMAPLTLVRTEKQADLAISVAYNKKYTPQTPIEPKPSKITLNGPESKYTWKVLTDGMGYMKMNDIAKRIKMIWWEALRHEANTQVSPTQAVRVSRGELKTFLAASLEKMGVHSSESGAFAHYWDQVFKNDYDSKNAPFVLVQCIDSAQHENFIPNMKVTGKDAEDFSLNRFYFRFELVSDATMGQDAESYLANLAPVDLGPNTVIDLGGEVAKSPAVTERVEWKGRTAFNNQFIEEHIYAG